MEPLFSRLYSLLRWSERYTKTDMVYLASGGFWLVVGQVGAAVMALIFSLVVAWYLPPHIYGSYKYILSLATIIGAISLTGLGMTIVRSVAQGNDKSLSSGFKTGMVASIPMLLIFIGFAGYYAYQGDQGLAVAILIAGIAMPLINNAALFNAFWNGKKNFYRQTLYWSIANVLSTGAAIIAMLLTDNVAILIGAYFLTSALSNGALYLLTLKDAVRAEAPEPQTKDAFHLSIINFLNTVSSNIDKIIVFQLLGTVQLAIYSFALALPDQIRNTLKSGARLALPRFAEQPLATIESSITQKMVRFGVIIVLMTIAYIVVAPYIFEFFFPAYKESVPYSQLLALSILSVLGMAPLTALQAHVQHRALYTHAILTNVIQISSSILLITFYGLWGAVVSVLLNRVVALILPLFLLKQTVAGEPSKTNS